MSTTTSASSSSFSSIRASLASTPTSALHLLNHALHVKLDHMNYVIWRLQMDNVIFVNGLKTLLKVL